MQTKDTFTPVQTRATPRVYEARNIGGDHKPTIRLERGGTLIATIDLSGYQVGVDISPAEWAGLIVRSVNTAPALLEALRSTRLMLYAFKGARRNMGLQDNHQELNDSIAQIETAIAAATGE